MKLTPEQQRVLKIALAEAKRMGASPRERKALVEAGLVESNLTNVNHGDRDSLGFLQQRPSQGWGTPEQVTNVRYATRQFLERARQANTVGGSAGSLAQRVQRSAFPERYDQRSGDAESLLGGARGSTGSTRGGAASRSSTVPGVDRSKERQALLLGYLENRHDPNALLSLGTGLKAAQDTPASKINLGSTSSSTSTPSGTPHKALTSISSDVKALGLAASGKRSASSNASVGGAQDSDHLPGADRDARDFTGTLDQMKQAGSLIAKRLGIKGYQYGGNYTVTKNGIRWQLITAEHGTGPHVHLGARKV